MNKRTYEAIECARQNRANGIVGFAQDAEILDLVGELDRLTLTLHCRQAHPDFEYVTTQTARKSGADPRIGLDGDGWEPNEIVPCHAHVEGAVVKEHWRNWERYQFHEDNYWRRRTP